MTERATLTDAAGRPVASYVFVERRSGPMADLLLPAPGVALDDVVATVFERLPGWLAGTEDRALGHALERAGGRRRRFAHVMAHDLRAGAPLPAAPVPPGATIVPFSRVDDDLAAATLAAYGPGHPDHEHHLGPQARDSLEALVAGKVIGPLLRASRAARLDGRQVGAIVITGSPGEPPEGGPWIGELLRAPGPRLAGLGAALLAAALQVAREDGLAGVGLAVSDGNPARALYERFGFAHVAAALTVLIPGAPAAPPAPPTPR